MNEIAIVGEAWGEQEEKARTPFVGTAGYALTQMLDEAGISRAGCFLTNVFNLRPPSNRIEALCGPKSEGLQGYPALVKGKHVRAEYAPELERLGSELVAVNPNVIIALGNTAMWALLGRTAISKFRGTTDLSTHTASGYKVLPTYHPAAVLRQWELRPVTILDLMKAQRESVFPEIRRPQREIWIEPTYEDIITFHENYIVGCEILSVDIENPGGPLDCIGFAPRPNLGIVIPFIDKRKKGRNYWETPELESKVIRYVKRTLEDKKIKKLFQNGAYDMNVLWRLLGIKTFRAEDDSMLLHHALQPEALKALGFLGSIYTDEGPWKHDRSKWESFKKDD